MNNFFDDHEDRKSHNEDAEDELRHIVESELIMDGWSYNDGEFNPPTYTNKDDLRQLHRYHRIEKAEREQKIVEKYGGDLLHEFANGNEIDPNQFDPELIKVVSNTWENHLFRFASLLWSIPISQGYGRRMRYLVKDRFNNKLVGLIALGDPVFNLKARDDDIGWKQADRRERLYHVLDAFGLGAVPPYNRLLAGKYVALAAVSDEIRKDFEIKYKGRKTIIQNKEKEPTLSLITTTSALGRSSIYNRLRLPDEGEPVYRSVGFSAGFGHFHISDQTFNKLREWLRSQDNTYADKHVYGDGPSWRMRTIRQALNLLGFQRDLLRHGVKREVFLVPLAKNYREFLRGVNGEELIYYNRNIEKLTQFFKERWMIPRSKRIDDWKEWTRYDTWRIIKENCGNNDWVVNLKMF